MLINLLDQGGLCNRLTHAAVFLAASKEYGFPVIHAPLAKYHRKLPVITNNLVCISPQKGFYSATAFAQTTASRAIRSGCKKFLRKQSNRYLSSIDSEYSNVSLVQEGILDKARKSLLCFDFGWPTIPNELVEKHKSFILHQLQFSPNDVDTVRKEINSIRSDAGDVIGLHMRRGDYAAIKNGQYFWSIEQYKMLAQQLTQSTQNKIVLCSNETVNAEDWRDLAVHNFEPDQIKDILRLSQCDYIIGPPSTFSAWAAFIESKPIAHLEQADAEINFQSPQLMGSLE